MERPIILKPHEVRAILEGRQTQLRRIVKRQPEKGRELKPRRNRAGNIVWMSWRGKPEDANPETGIYGAGWDLCKCPYGQPGDRLWVRETWASCDCLALICPGFIYRSTGETLHPGDRWKPATQMPRWASRILLEIVDVRVERLLSCSEEDAEAEGVEADQHSQVDESQTIEWQGSYFAAFLKLWETIHGRGSCDANPWVWVVTFKRVAA